MKRNFIRNIIVLATLLLIALVITQVSWVKKAYELEEKQFSYNVTQSLLRTLDNLKKASGDSSITLNPIDQKKPNFYVVKIHYISDPYLIESLLEIEFKQASINEDFIFNIYDCFSDSVVYCQNVKFDSKKKKDPIPNLKWNKDQGHYFSVYFPGHSSGIFYHMEFWIYSSIILIVVILFFGFIISQMLKQRRVSDMKTDFINNMTHEFKTPISTISISVNALAKDNICEKPDKLAKYVSIIQSENQRLKEQVERILQAATIEKEKVNIKNQPLHIHEVLQRIIEVFKVNIESKSGIIQTQFDAANDMILGDEEHLKNIFSNLIDNAIKYSPDELNISIATQSTAEEISISISDKGLGIDSEYQPYIFEKFYRVPTGNLHDVKGFGIGLNYVYLLVHKHHGKIKLKSQPGEGSTFVLTFKLVQ
ncbi:HAMP domain-containing histidine kinase [bacterium SCSIO 12643]|nr:HAMP domain-containing histidine kinase [bacterium SCSIO 12643]